MVLRGTSKPGFRNFLGVAEFRRLCHICGMFCPGASTGVEPNSCSLVCRAWCPLCGGVTDFHRKEFPYGMALNAEYMVDTGCLSGVGTVFLRTCFESPLRHISFERHTYKGSDRISHRWNYLRPLLPRSSLYFRFRGSFYSGFTIHF